MPKVTVIVPTYNRAELLSQTIDSVLDQTFQNWELIIVDDGSTDDTEEIIGQYTDERIQYFRFDQNRGANHARNKGIQEARGTYVSFLDSDDIVHSKHLEFVVSALESTRDRVGGVYTSFRQIKADDPVDIHIADKILDHPNQVIERYTVGGFSVLTFRRSVFERVGLLDTDFRAFQDREFLIRFLDNYELHPVEELLVTYRIHGGRLSTNTERKLDALNELAKKHGNRFSNKGWSHVWYTRGFLHMNSGDTRKANACFRRSFRLNPTNWLALLQIVLSLFGSRVFNSGNRAKRQVRRRVLIPISRYLS